MRKIEEILTEIENSTLDYYRNSITRNRYIEDMGKVRKALEENGPSDTDFVLLKRLSEVYRTAQRGIVSGPEMELIQNYLEINGRTIIQLRNLRNTVVIMLGPLFKDDYDKVSAITHIIDMELVNRGEAV
jgi:hypothetical protein